MWNKPSIDKELEDLEVKDLLIGILIELRKINIHLYSMTDEEIEEDGRGGLT